MEEIKKTKREYYVDFYANKVENLDETENFRQIGIAKIDPIQLKSLILKLTRIGFYYSKSREH